MSAAFFVWRCCEGAALTVLADHIDLYITLFAGVDQGMTCFGAEVWNIDNRRRIIRVHFQLIACFKRLQTLARFEDGKRAEQPDGI